MQKRYVHAFLTDAKRTNATNNGVWRNQGLPVFEKKKNNDWQQAMYNRAR